jgi:hypothetical protein
MTKTIETEYYGTITVRDAMASPDGTSLQPLIEIRGENVDIDIYEMHSDEVTEDNIDEIIEDNESGY